MNDTPDTNAQAAQLSELQLLSVLNEPRPEHFSAAFLEEVAFSKVSPFLKHHQQRYGKALSARPSGEEKFWQVRAERGDYSVLAVLDANGQFSGLRIPPKESAPWLGRALVFLPWAVLFILLRGVWTAWQMDSIWAWLADVPVSLGLAAVLLTQSVWPQTWAGFRFIAWLSFGALLASSFQLLSLPRGAPPSMFSTLFDIALLAVLLNISFQSLRGRRQPSGAVELGPVLSGGSFVVAQGGSTAAINYHMAHPHMRYAVDFIGVGPNGRHARGLVPADPERYAIFGGSVLAPLGGVVEACQDGRPDQRVPHSDTLRPAGNFVVLLAAAPDGREIRVLLCHLRRGSLQVKVGDTVRAGQTLGQVGNSGNTSEPHLHIGVNVGGQASDPFSGEGVPFTVAGRFPVRGQRWGEIVGQGRPLIST